MDDMLFKGVTGKFRLIPNFAFAVGNNGKIVGLRTGKEKKPHINPKSGLAQVMLHYDGKYKMCYVHRLVAEAWLPNPNNYPYITHINGINSDNRVENLKWISVDEWKENKSKELKAIRNGKGK